MTEFVNEETGRCWPTVDTLADMVAADERTVQRALTALVGAGALEIVEKGGGRKKTTVYQITIPRQDCQGIEEQNGTETVTAVTETVTETVTAVTETVTAVTETVTETVTAVTETVTAVSPEPNRTLGTYSEPTDSETVAPAAPAAEPGLDLNGAGFALPRADFSTIAEWPVEWPGETKIRTYLKTVEQARESISMKAIQVLGYSLDDWRAQGGAGGTTLGQLRLEVEAALGAELIRELARRMVGGELTEGDLAHVLAHAGFTHRGAGAEAAAEAAQ